MSTPIRREDIRKGDRIRSVREYTAKADHPELPNPNAADLTYELIERPVVLPGVYVNAADCPDVFQLDSDGQWWCGNTPVTVEQVRHDGGSSLTLLRPVAEVAAEVLAEVVQAYSDMRAPFQDHVENLRTKYESP